MANSVFMAADAIVELQASSVPIGAGNVPMDTGFSEPAIITTALRLATPFKFAVDSAGHARSSFENPAFAGCEGRIACYTALVPAYLRSFAGVSYRRRSCPTSNSA
jgi:hypothetical protein